MDTSRLLASSTHYVQPIAIQPQHIKSCNQSPTHHPVGVGLHARPRGLSGHLTLTSIIQLPYTNTPTSCSRGQADSRQTDRTFILINHSSFAIKMSQPNINTPNSDLVSFLSQSQSYLSPYFLVILPGLTSSVRLCGVERCPAQQSEEEEEEGITVPCRRLPVPTIMAALYYYPLFELSNNTSDAQTVIFTCRLNNNSSNVFLLAKTVNTVK